MKEGNVRVNKSSRILYNANPSNSSTFKFNDNAFKSNNNDN